MKAATIVRLAIPLMFAIGLSSCGVEPVAVNHVEPTRFLTSTKVDTTKKIPRLPFQHSWRAPDTNIEDYKNIVVRPVTTSFLKTDKWEESKSAFIPNKRAYVRETQKLTRYWNRSLAKSFKSPVCMFYKTNDTSQPKTLILEIALTEVRFDRAAKTPAAKPDSTTPPPGTVTTVLTGVPVCAFEARVRDAATGKLISTAADRRGPELTVIGSTKDTFTKPNEKICDEWADQLMKSSNIELFPKVRRKWFSLF